MTPKEVIEITSGYYDYRKKGNYMCYSISYLLHNGLVSLEDGIEAQRSIRASIHHYSTVDKYLFGTGYITLSELKEFFDVVPELRKKFWIKMFDISEEVFK